ncbi:hypothetical protein ACHQM5_014744 [Ranunculus cassubicifolius]
METLVIVPQHRNQYYGRNFSHVHERFDYPMGRFRDINCRSQAREGLLSPPLTSSDVEPTTKKNASPSMTKKTPSPKKTNLVGFHSEGAKQFRSNGKSNPIPIILKPNKLEKSFSDDLSYSELWAGPAYSNSPPPSSLPIPNFSLRQKRSVSLELPVRELAMKVHPVSKSAPSSPRGGSCPSPDNFLRSNASAATKDLRRILNLNIADE